MPTVSTPSEIITMTANFEAADACTAKISNNIENAAAACARDAWSRDNFPSPGDQNKFQLDTQLNSRLALLQTNDVLLNTYLNAANGDIFTQSKGDFINAASGIDSRLDKVKVDRDDKIPGVSVREYRGLDSSYRNDRVRTNSDAPDATVIIPKGFDPNKPVRVVVFNHGLRGSGADWAKDAELAKQMAAADPQTIMVIPEWQSNPSKDGKPNPDSSRVYQPGFFRNQLQEIFNATPELRGKKVDDIESMGIIAHSAGGRAAKAQLEVNGFGDKVTSVTVLDAMYNRDLYTSWMRANKNDLVSGRKDFRVFYQDDIPSDDPQRRMRRQVMEDETTAALGRNAIPEHSFDRTGRNANDPSVLNRRGVVFVKDGRHDALPRNHIRKILEVEKSRKSGA